MLGGKITFTGTARQKQEQHAQYVEAVRRRVANLKQSIVDRVLGGGNG